MWFTVNWRAFTSHTPDTAILYNLTWRRGDDVFWLWRVATGFWKPRNASTSCVPIHRKRSSPWVKTAWSFRSKTMILSPGFSTGSWSPSQWNVIFRPFFMPLSIWTPVIFSQTIFFPLQILHLALGVIHFLWPWNSMLTDWICWPIPGPIWWILICIPVLQQLRKHSTVPFLPLRPSYLSQVIIFSELVFLLYH